MGTTRSLFAVDTGELTGLCLAGSDEDFAANTPAGHAWVEGDFNPRRFSVEMHVDDFGQAFPRAVPRTPPRPADNAYQTWAWDEAAGDWAPSPTALWRAAQVRAQRDRLLAASDWVAARATETATAIPPDWLAYRNALRDLPAQPGFPDSVTWPLPPAS